MSDDNNGLDAPKQQTGDSADKVDLSQLPPSVREYIQSLNNEAASWRTKFRKLEVQISDAEQKRLEEEGKFKDLYEKAQGDVQKLTPYQQRAETLEKKLIATNEKREALLPDYIREVIKHMTPEQKSEWLDANEVKFTTPPAPNLNAGAGGGGGGGNSAPQLTAEELAIAKQSGLTPEQYAKQKK